MVEFSAEVNTVAVHRAIKAAPKQFEVQLADALDHIKRKYFKTLLLVTGLNKRKSRFMRAFKGYVNRKGNRLNSLSMRITTYWKAARLHEFGGQKVARSGKMMAIPIGGALNASGQVKSRYRTPGKVDGLISLKRNGRVFLFRRSRMRGSKGKLIPMYLLIDQARLVPRLRFGQTWEQLQPFVQERINAAAQRALERTEQA